MPIDAAGCLSIVHNGMYLEGVFRTPHCPVPFEEFVRFQEPMGQEKPRKPRGTQVPPDMKTELLQRWPWLRESDSEGLKSSGVKKAKGSDDEGSDDDGGNSESSRESDTDSDAMSNGTSDPDVPVEELDAADVAGELSLLRDEYLPGDGTDFFLYPRFGWSVDQAGKKGRCRCYRRVL